MRDYPKSSQANKPEKQVLILVRLYDISDRTNWWLSEYDRETEVAY
jgi:hypothetical protein